MFGKAGISGLRKRGHVMKTSARHAFKVSYHTFSPLLEIERFLVPGSFRNVPVDFLFVVYTLENIHIVQSFSDDRLQCYSILISYS